MDTYSFLNNNKEYNKLDKTSNYIVFDKKNYSSNLHNYSSKPISKNKSHYLHGYFNRDEKKNKTYVQSIYKNSFIDESSFLDKSNNNDDNSLIKDDDIKDDNKSLINSENYYKKSENTNDISKYYIYKVDKKNKSIKNIKTPNDKKKENSADTKNLISSKNDGKVSRSYLINIKQEILIGIGDISIISFNNFRCYSKTKVAQKYYCELIDYLVKSKIIHGKLLLSKENLAIAKFKIRNIQYINNKIRKTLQLIREMILQLKTNNDNKNNIVYIKIKENEIHELASFKKYISRNILDKLSCFDDLAIPFEPEILWSKKTIKYLRQVLVLDSQITSFRSLEVVDYAINISDREKSLISDTNNRLNDYKKFLDININNLNRILESKKIDIREKLEMKLCNIESRLECTPKITNFNEYCSTQELNYSENSGKINCLRNKQTLLSINKEILLAISDILVINFENYDIYKQNHLSKTYYKLIIFFIENNKEIFNKLKLSKKNIILAKHNIETLKKSNNKIQYTLADLKELIEKACVSNIINNEMKCTFKNLKDKLLNQGIDKYTLDNELLFKYPSFLTIKLPFKLESIFTNKRINYLTNKTINILNIDSANEALYEIGLAIDIANNESILIKNIYNELIEYEKYIENKINCFNDLLDNKKQETKIDLQDIIVKNKSKIEYLELCLNL